MYKKEFKIYKRWHTIRLLLFGWPFQWFRGGLRPFKLAETSPISASHEQGGLNTKETVTVAYITDCSTITVHAGKCYKDLIDSGAAISLIRYSMYQLIDNSFKTPIQPTTAKLNAADGSPMTALGMTALHLRIAYFKFTHNFIICDRLLYTELIFGIDVQKKFSIPYVWDKAWNCDIQKAGKFLTYTRNCEQKATIGIVKSTHKIPPRHNGFIPIKITGQAIKEHMAYFITDEDSTKRRDPNNKIINGIHNIKGKTSVNVSVSNYTNKHITFNKGEYVGHLEPAIEDNVDNDLPSHAQPETHSTHNVTTQWMMAEQVEPDTFYPPHQKLKSSMKSKLDALLREYASQFVKDETSIGTAPLTEMMIDPGFSESVFQKPYPITMKNYQWVKDEIEKLLTAKVIWSSRSCWSAPIIVVPKGDGETWLVISYYTLNKVNRNFTLPIPKVEDIFSKLNGAKYFSTLDLWAGYHHIPLDKSSIPKMTFN